MISIQALIDESIKKSQESRKDKPRSGKISPSGLGRCFRYQYLYRKGEPPSNPIDERTLRVFKVGDLFHDFVQGFLPDYQSEVRCEQDDILGYADVVLDDSVLDIKSQHSFAWHYMEKPGYNVYKEKLNNWLQVACYAEILEKPKVGLVLISKDDLCIAQYWSPTERFSHELSEELTQVRFNWASQKEPPAKPRCYIDKKTGKSKECGFCLFQDKCKGEIDENGKKGV